MPTYDYSVLLFAKLLVQPLEPRTLLFRQKNVTMPFRSGSTWLKHLGAVKDPSVE